MNIQRNKQGMTDDTYRRVKLSPAAKAVSGLFQPKRLIYQALLLTCFSFAGQTLFVKPVYALDVSALPSGGQVTAGAATINQSGTTLNINQATQNAALSWQAFNIGANATVNFIQPNSSAVALNHILSNSGSEIYGHLNANGQVFLLNPNGILFAPGAQVNVGSIFASTLQLSDSDFLAGKLDFTQPGSGSIINQGNINAAGSAVLAANNVGNTGNIFATTISFVAGDTVAVNLTTDGLIRARVSEPTLVASLDNSGLLSAAQINLSAAQAQGALNRVVNNSGIIRATGISNLNGEVSLDGGTVNNTGTISSQNADGSGGTIALLGDMESGTVNVNGTLDASATGAGNGGFIETSAAHVKVNDAAVVTTYAVNGNSGTWLIDPNDYIVGSGGDISGYALGINLDSGNVVISSNDGVTSGNGDIFINENVSWNANTSLSLNAVRDISINSVIHSDNGSVILTAGRNVTLGTSRYVDDEYFTYNLPFAFTFFGNTYTQAFINSNGLITFGSGTSAYSDSPSGLSSYVGIAPAWNDWEINPANGQDIHLGVANNSLTIRYDVTRYYQTGQKAAFEAVLNSDGAIKFNYGAADSSFAGDVTTGISNGTGSLDFIFQPTNLNYMGSVTYTPNGNSYIQAFGATTPLSAPGLVSGGLILASGGNSATAAISAIYGDVIINAGGSISAPLGIDAQELQFTSHGGAAFSGNNHIGSIGASHNYTSGDIIFYNTASPLTISGLDNHVGNLVVDNTGGISITGAVHSLASMLVQAHSPINVTNTGSLSAGGNLTLVAFSTSPTSLTDLLNINGSLSSGGGNVNLTGGSGVSFGASASVSAPNGSIAAASPYGPVTADPAASFFAPGGIIFTSYGSVVYVPPSDTSSPTSGVDNVLSSINNSDDKFKQIYSTVAGINNVSDPWKEVDKDNPVKTEKKKGKTLQCSAQ